MAREKDPEITFNALSESQLSAAFKVVDRTVRKWVLDGCPQNPDRTFCIYNVKEWLLERQKKEILSDFESDDTNLKDEKLKLEIEKLRLVVEEKKLSLIPISDHHDVCESRLRTLRDYMQRNLPAQADRFVNIQNRDEVRELLEKLAEKLLDVYISGADEIRIAENV